MKRSLFGVAQVAGLRGFGALALLLLTWVVTRTLELAEAGRFLYLLAIIVVGAPVMVFGTNLASLRRIAIEDGRTGPEALGRLNGVIVQGLALVIGAWLVVAATLGLVAVTTASLWPAELSWLLDALPLLLPAMLVTALSILVAHQLQGLSRPTHSIVTLSIAGPVTFSALMLLRPDAYADAGDALALLLASNTIALGYGAACLARLLRPVRPAPGALGPFVAACLPIWVVAVCTVLTNWGAQLVSIGWLAAEDIALVNVAQRLAMSVSLVLIAVNLIVSPRIAQLHDRGETAALQRLVSRAVLGVTLLALPAILAICLFPRTVLGLFGAGYADAAPYLIVFGLGQLVNVVTGPAVQLLTMTGHERTVMRIAVASSVLTLTLAVALLELVGAIGVPVAVAAGIACQNVSSAVQARRRLGVAVLAWPGRT